MSPKQTLFGQCVSLLEVKMQELDNSIKIIEEAIQNETKSTAGDKHETSRAMMQLEREKLGNQLKDLAVQKSELQKIDTSLVSEKIIKGSLVRTDKGSFFIAIALGKTDSGVYVISPQSPLGNKLMGLKQNDKAEINGTAYVVKEIS